MGFSLYLLSSPQTRQGGVFPAGEGNQPLYGSFYTAVFGAVCRCPEQIDAGTAGDAGGVGRDVDSFNIFRGGASPGRYGGYLPGEENSGAGLQENQRLQSEDSRGRCVGSSLYR